MEQKKKKLYPMKFKPVSKDTDGVVENVEVADLGYIDSEIENGWLSGSTISEVMETYLEDVVGENVYSRYGRQFPVQVKRLDVKGRLPLCVCPDDEIASQRYDTLGKKKLWYVADAAPGSCLYLGFRREISASELYDRCHNGSLDDVLNPIAPHRGDVFLITPGLVHSASGGVVIAEISEASDLDFNIYNWGDKVQTVTADFTADPAGVGRAEKKQTKRRNLVDDEMDKEELSLEAAFDFVNLSAYDEELKIGAAGHSAVAYDSNVKSFNAVDDNSDKVADKLAEMREFTVTKLEVKDALRIDAGTTDAFMLYECVNGAASLQVHRESGEIDRYGFAAGEAILVPADVTEFFIVPQDRDTVLLEITIEPYEQADDYIDPEAEEKLLDEDDADKVASIEEFLRKNPGKMN